MCALRAVAAILRTTTSLDTEEARGFDVVRIEILAMNALRLKHQVGKASDRALQRRRAPNDGRRLRCLRCRSDAFFQQT